MMRVLIVDDKEENLYYLEALLRGHHYEVTTARHGAEALVKARQQLPDLVISDLLMPIMDGYTLLRHWKADERLKPVPFIVYTATYTEAEDERLALNLGADAFILKPAEPEEFLTRIREVETRATATVSVPSNQPIPDEKELLKVYSETLIRKLEEKMLQLEKSNRALQQDIAVRRQVEADRQKLVHDLGERVKELRALHEAAGVLRDDHATTREILERVAAILPGAMQYPQVTAVRLSYGEIACATADFRPTGNELVARFTTNAGRAGQVEIAYLAEKPPADEGPFVKEERELIASLAEMLRVYFERRDAEDALRESAARFRRSFQDAAIGMSITTPEGKYLEANAAFCRMLGYSEAELRQLDFPALTHAEDRVRQQELLRELIAGKRDSFILEKRYIAKNGRTVWARLSVSPLREAGGTPDRFIGVAEDITDLKQAEQHRQELLAREQAARREADAASHYYRSLFESAPGSYLVLTAENYTIAAVSDAFLLATRTTREQLQGQNIFAVFPDDPAEPAADGVKTLRNSLDRVKSLGRADVMGVQRYPIPRPANEGGGFEERYWSPVNTPVPGPDGKIAFIIHRVEDVTEYVRLKHTSGRESEVLKKLESRTEMIEMDIILRSHELKRANERLAQSTNLLRMAGQAARLGGWALELPEQKLIWSDEIRAIHEVAPDYTPPLEEAIQFYTPEHREKVSRAVQTAIETGASFDFELEIISAKGRRLWVRAIGEVVRNEAGKIIRLQGAFQDISAQKAAEAEARQLADRLTTTLESITDAFFTLDQHWRFTFLNSEAERLLARRRQDLIDREVWVEFPAAIGTNFERNYRAAMAQQQAVAFDEFYPPLNAWFAVRAFPSALGLAVYFRDITATRQAAEALRQSEERFREMAENIGDVFYNYDPTNDRLLYANRAYERIWGRPLDQIYANPTGYLEDIHAEDRPAATAAFERQLAGEVTDTEFRVLRPDGTIRWVHEHGVPIRDATGKVERIVGTMRDITASKQAEAKRRESEERFLLLAKAAPDAIWDLDPVTGTLWWNEGFATHFGYDSGSVTPTYAVWQERVHPEDWERVAANVDQTVAATKANFTNEYRFRRADGSYAYVMDRGYIIYDAAGQPRRLIGSIQDLTARKRAEEQLRASEERFRELAETINEVFWINDPIHQKILYVSPAYEEIWGRPAASLYEAPHTWIATLHPDDQERMARAFAGVTDQPEYSETYRIVRPDGEIRWIHDRAFPVRDAAGSVIRVVGAAEDITTRRQLEEQFRQAQKMEAIGQLAAGVAHDFNNILAAILGNTQLAIEDIPPAHPARESLEEIKKASVRATDLVQQILAFSRQRPRERHVLELGTALQDSVKFLRASIPAVVAMELTVDPAAPPILGDPTQLHQLITNLCTNAWHALEDQPGRIEIKLQTVSLDASAARRLAGLKPGPFVLLSVADTGKGIEARVLDRIFDPFFTTKSPGKGTGLGLSVVHGIVQSHNGAITVSSHPGRGTTFQIYFPAAAAPVATVPPPEPEQTPRGTGQHILYLDDEAPLVLLAERMLERLGYRISAFTRAAEAEAAFRQDPNQFDLVITDLNMPGVSGLDVATRLLKIRPNLPVVICSGHVTEELRERARGVGIKEVLYKPNTMQEFSESIHRLAKKTCRT